MRTSVEYAQHDENHPPPNNQELCVSMPVHTGMEANAVTQTQAGKLPAWTPDRHHVFKR